MLSASLFALAAWSKAQPTRQPRGDAVVVGHAEALPEVAGGRMWRLSAPDPRFGGVSALALDRGELVALTDSGVAVRFAPPEARQGAVQFRFHDLPAGPGAATRKRGRDSEALLADPRGHGWWVAFEGEHSLWRYDRGFSRALERRSLSVDWPSNRGAEALIEMEGDLRPIPEGGDELAPGGTSDAVRLSGGRLALLVRRFGWRGFVNEVRIASGSGQAVRILRLPFGPLDNAEAIAAAPLPGGGTRLWIMTDDNFRPWMRTLLVALDLPPGA